ncbi:hypothetical protein YPPY64_4756, partial [Yersinia pestis PY-64]|jgi:hypothetical protein
MAD